MRKSLVIAILLVLGAGILMLYLPLSSPADVFNTPDESANYFFSRNFISYDEFRTFEPLEKLVDNAIHPRGVNVVRGFLVPESFLGILIIYGNILKFLPAAASYFLAFLTIVTLPLLYLFFKSFFEVRVARLGLFLVLSLPAFIYFANRPFLHNILFLDLIIIGLWLLGRASPRWSIVSGIVLGMALAVRTSEALWVAIAALFLLLSRRELIFKRGIQVVIGVILGILPVLLMNQDLYGSALHVGYSVTESTFAENTAVVPQLSKISFLSQLFFPFGLHIFSALRRFIQFGLSPMWWYVAPLLLGTVIALKRKHNYAVIWSTLSLYLIFSYGSFNAEIFADPTHPLQSSIGAPYVRYWLPLFVFGAPLAAQFFLWLRKILSFRFYIIHSAFYIIFAIFSLTTVFWRGPESLSKVNENLWQFEEARERAVRTTSKDAVFLVPRWADRIYFPERKVIVDVVGKDVIKIIDTLIVEKREVFWLRGKGEIKLEPELLEAGFQFKRRFDIDPKGKIYEIVSKT